MGLTGWLLVCIAPLVLALLWVKYYRRTPVLLVLVYEKIGTAPKKSPFKKQWTSLSTLRRTWSRLKANGFTFITPNQCTGSLPPKSVLLVFLSGYRSFYSEVYPLLTELNVPACICLPAGYASTHNAWQNPQQEPWQDLLTEAEIAQLTQDNRIYWGTQFLPPKGFQFASQEEVQFAAQEGLLRFTRQFQRPATLFACWPRVTPPLVLPQLSDFNGPIITLQPGVNHTPGRLLKTRWGNSFTLKLLLR